MDSQLDLQQLWTKLVAYVEPRWLPSLIVLALAGLIYIVAGWILRRLQKRLAARTETDLDDEFLRALRKVVRLTVVAWAISQLLGEWVPPLVTVTEGVRELNDVQPQDWVWGIWTVLVFFPISRFVGHVMATFEQKVMSRTDTALDETALPMVNRFVRFLVIAVGVLLALPRVGISIAPLLGGAGVMGLALSFAAKDTLSNLIAGVLLIMDRPFKVGDRIELWNAPRETGTWGDVIEIGLRATKIRNPDNLVVVVPNNEIMRRDIINYTMSGDDIRLQDPLLVRLRVGHRAGEGAAEGGGPRGEGREARSRPDRDRAGLRAVGGQPAAARVDHGGAVEAPDRRRDHREGDGGVRRVRGGDPVSEAGAVHQGW